MADLEPLFGLRLRTRRLELRLPNERELVVLGELAREGIHPPEEMPFAVAWSNDAGSPDFVQNFVAFHQRARKAWEPDDWNLLLAVEAEGRLAGTQGIEAERFAERER